MSPFEWTDVDTFKFLLAVLLLYATLYIKIKFRDRKTNIQEKNFKKFNIVKGRGNREILQRTATAPPRQVSAPRRRRGGAVWHRDSSISDTDAYYLFDFTTWEEKNFSTIWIMYLPYHSGYRYENLG